MTESTPSNTISPSATGDDLVRLYFRCREESSLIVPIVKGVLHIYAGPLVLKKKLPPFTDADVINHRTFHEGHYDSLSGVFKLYEAVGSGGSARVFLYMPAVLPVPYQPRDISWVEDRDGWNEEMRMRKWFEMCRKSFRPHFILVHSYMLTES